MPPIFHLEEVSFAYPRHSLGLSPVSFEIQAGEAVLLAGASGSGKSTLARCLVGLIPHLYRGRLGGRVWLAALRTDRTPLWRLAELAGLVFQNPAVQMLAPTVEEELIFGLENLGLASGEIEGRLATYLARFDLGRLRSRSPQTLSGGEQQKLALAAVLSRQPPALVLDEPLSMLDSTSALELVSALKELAGSGTTVVVCEHRLEYLQSIPGLRTLRLGMGEQRPEAGELPARPGPPGAAGGFQLQVEDLSVERGGHQILESLSFSLPAGQVVALVGRNGAGKTTLLRTLAGLQRPAGGRLAIRGDGRRASPDLGLVFQNPDLQLFNPTVREELLYHMPDPDFETYAWLLEALALAPYEATPPLLLSEGQKRRVALATVLMRRPRHGILLDEPALGQDAGHKTILLRTLRSLARSGQLVLLATHDLELAAHADRLILISEGRFLADGPPHKVLGQAAVWQRAGLRLPEWFRPVC